MTHKLVAAAYQKLLMSFCLNSLHLRISSTSNTTEFILLIDDSCNDGTIGDVPTLALRELEGSVGNSNR